MTRERGFRRLAVALSLLGLCLGIGLTAHSWYRTQLFFAAAQEQRWCEGENPTQEKLDKCRREHNTPPLPAHVMALIKIAWDTSRIQSALDLGPLLDRAAGVVSAPIAEIDQLGRYVLILGAVVTLGLAALPWAAFYVLRWIVGGFHA